MITITKSATSSRVAVSCGRRLAKRMQPSLAWSVPVMITSPSTSRALAKIDPIKEVCATTISPDPSANRTMKNSGRFPSVDCRNPVTAGPNRRPTCSVANATTQANPAKAAVAAAKARTALAFE
jgi:hypothetical protein